MERFKQDLTKYKYINIVNVFISTLLTSWNANA